MGIAAAAIGAIAGSIITDFSESGIYEVIEQKENVIVLTVEDNLIRINQDTQDNKNLKQTLKMVLDETISWMPNKTPMVFCIYNS